MSTQNNTLIDDMINHVADEMINKENMVNDNMPDSWKQEAKEQIVSDMHKVLENLEYNFDKFLDWLSGNPQSQDLPKLDDLIKYPSDPNLTYDPKKLTPIPTDSDIDHDGIPDWLDPDMDNDGIPDAEDSDRDGDGIPDAIDPDPLTPEPNPKDGHPFAPLPPLLRRDPLVLDMNKDGLISTVSLADSTAFFDLTGDGIKEKVGWVQASEGIVAFDKNGNGKIDGISEVFGTATTSGFAELRTLADSNYDGVIDRRDELYNQLKVWQDTNQDGIINNASELFGNYTRNNDGSVAKSGYQALSYFENNSTYTKIQRKAA